MGGGTVVACDIQEESFVRSKKLLMTELEGQMEYRLVSHPKTPLLSRCCRIHSCVIAHLSMPPLHPAMLFSFHGLIMRMGIRQGGGWRQHMGLDAD